MANDDKLDLLEEEEEESSAAQKDEETEQLASELDIPAEDAQDNVIELPDGSVIINFTKTKPPFEDSEHYANLADSLEEGELWRLAEDYLELIAVDIDSRAPRDKQYEEGLLRTGLGQPAPGGATFEGASKITHPIFAQAVVDFSSSTIKEMLPPGDLVRTSIRGTTHKKDVLERANRKATFLNWQLNEQICEYRDESEQLVTQLAIGGSQYKKYYFDHDLKRPCVQWLPVDQLILPFNATSVYTASRVTEIEDITFEALRVRIDQGIYRDLDALSADGLDPLHPPTTNDDFSQTATKDANDKIEGKAPQERDVDGVRRLYHVYAWLRLKDDPKTRGERAPYYFTIDVDLKEVLGLYRNWESGDESFVKLDWIIEYKFIPWRGALGIGLPHLIGGLSSAATGALRSLLDSAHNQNFQAVVSLKSGVTGESLRIEPGQIVELNNELVDDVRKALMPMPFPPPSPVLYQLLDWITQAATGVATVADEKMAELPANTSATQVLNLVESSGKVFSSIHARLHRSQQRELAILSRLNYWYLDQMQNLSGVPIEVKDFASNTDIIPISDPHIFSETQRLSQAQAVLALAQTAKDPKMYDERKLHEMVLKAMRIPYIEEVMPNPDGVVEANPVIENVKMAMGKMSSAYPDQDHLAHIMTHLAFAKDPNYGANPLLASQLIPVLLAHIRQHLIMHYLQSVIAQVKRDDTDGEDIFSLHEEKAIGIIEQQSIMMTALKISEQNKDVFSEILKDIETLQQKASEQVKANQEKAMMADPSAAVLFKTEQAKLQFEAERTKQESQIKTAEIQQKYQAQVDALTLKVDELLAKYETDKELDVKKNQTAITIAAMNNDSREEVEKLKLGVGATTTQMQLEAERENLITSAQAEAAASLAKHGMDVEKLDIQNEAQAAQQALEAAQQTAPQAQNGQAAPPAAPPAPPQNLPDPPAIAQAPGAATEPPSLKAGGLAGQVIARELADGDLAKATVVDKLVEKKR